MATLSLLDRQRTRTRDRPRPNAPGNYITDQRRATVFSLTFTPTPQHYIKWWPYFFPETKAIGYRNDPPIVPQWVEVGPKEQINTVYDIAGGIIPGGAGAPIAPPGVPLFEGISPEVQAVFVPSPISIEQIQLLPTPPTNLTPGSTLITQAANKPGQTFTKTIGTTVTQLFNSQWPIRGVTLLADPDNVGKIWIGYDPQVQVNNGFPLVAGAAKDLNIDDLSQVYLIGSAAGQVLHVEYTK